MSSAENRGGTLADGCIGPGSAASRCDASQCSAISTPVPEPSSVALLVSECLLLRVRGRN